mgnify:CR=1 FL=1
MRVDCAVVPTGCGRVGEGRGKAAGDMQHMAGWRTTCSPRRVLGGGNKTGREVSLPARSSGHDAGALRAGIRHAQRLTPWRAGSLPDRSDSTVSPATAVWPTETSAWAPSGR